MASAPRTDIRELVKTRCWLEAKAVEESIANRDQLWEENLVLAGHRLSRTPRADLGQSADPEWEQRHREFHLALIAGRARKKEAERLEEAENRRRTKVVKPT